MCVGPAPAHLWPVGSAHLRTPARTRLQVARRKWSEVGGGQPTQKSSVSSQTHTQTPTDAHAKPRPDVCTNSWVLARTRPLPSLVDVRTQMRELARRLMALTEFCRHRRPRRRRHRTHTQSHAKYTACADASACEFHVWYGRTMK